MKMKNEMSKNELIGEILNIFFLQGVIDAETRAEIGNELEELLDKYIED